MSRSQHEIYNTWVPRSDCPHEIPKQVVRARRHAIRQYNKLHPHSPFHLGSETLRSRTWMDGLHEDVLTFYLPKVQEAARFPAFDPSVRKVFAEELDWTVRTLRQLGHSLFWIPGYGLGRGSGGNFGESIYRSAGAGGIGGSMTNQLIQNIRPGMPRGVDASRGLGSQSGFGGSQTPPSMRPPTGFPPLSSSRRSGRSASVPPRTSGGEDAWYASGGHRPRDPALIRARPEAENSEDLSLDVD